VGHEIARHHEIQASEFFLFEVKDGRIESFDAAQSNTYSRTDFGRSAFFCAQTGVEAAMANIKPSETL